MTWIQNFLAFIGLCVCINIFSSNIAPIFFSSLIPLFSDKFLWIEQDKCVPVVFVLHVIAFAYFVTFPDFRNSKRALQLDHFVRIKFIGIKSIFLFLGIFFESQK